MDVVHWLLETFGLTDADIHAIARAPDQSNSQETAEKLKILYHQIQVGEWRPRTHRRYPNAYRAAMRALVLLAKS